MNRPPKRRDRGFTIVEALVAGMILSLAAVAIGSSLSRTFGSLQAAKEYQRAAELLDLTLTKIDMFGPDRLLLDKLTGGTFGPPDENFAWEAEIESLPDAHLYEIEVQITWQGPKARRSVTAKTYLNDPPGSRMLNVDWEDL